MGRMYSVSFNEVAVTAVQDLFELTVGADQVMVVHELHVTQSSDAGDAQSEQLYVSIRRVTGSPTPGSGGSTPTSRPLDQGDSACTVAEATNNTTQLSGGTNVVLKGEAFNVMQGLHYVPVPDARPVFRGQTVCLVELETAPADSLTMSGYLVFEEIG